MSGEELIARLEKLSGPSVGMNCEIAKSVGWNYDPAMRTLCWTSPDGEVSRSLPPNYTGSADAARSLLPWKDHPGATFTSKTIQSGIGEFYHYTEFTWPSTERRGRARTEPIATCICALLAIEETERQIAPYRPALRSRASKDGGGE